MTAKDTPVVNKASFIKAFRKSVGTRPVSIEDIKRLVYKHTRCGAWVEVNTRHVQVGSIVEGVEAEAGPVTLIYPFTFGDFWSALEVIENEADAIWNATHGCEACAEHFDVDPMGDAVPVWSDCPYCDGEGIVL